MIIKESFSLLYPDDETQARHKSGVSLPDIPEEVVSQLGLATYLELKSVPLPEYLTVEAETILFRQRIFSDLLRTPQIGETLLSVFPILNDVLELRRLDTHPENSTESYLTSITEIELYVSCIEKLRDGLAGLRDRVESDALGRLIDAIVTLTESDYYRELNEKLNALSGRVREIKSITVGVNLDGQLRPTDAGVLAINAEEFKSGDLLEKILRLNFKDDEYTCIAPLVPFERSQSENRQMALSHAFNSAIADVFKASVKGWRKIVSEYVLDNTDFLLRLMPEIEFLVRGTRFLRRLIDAGLPLCTPALASVGEKTFTAVGLYNPDVALRSDSDIVKNDFAFDDAGRIFVLTGPNRGGKSVLTCAVGIAQIMAQLGMPVPADTLTLSPVRAIFTHFPSGGDDTIDKGRLGEECARLGEILECVDADSMILLDESLSSTGAYEASFIAAELLASFAVIGCRGIFSTHLHELAAHIAEINDRAAPRGGVRIDSLVAELRDGERSFRIVRRTPDGRSYASDIAEKYGLSFDTIMTKLGDPGIQKTEEQK